MLHLSNLGIWSDEERWEREKTMGKMKMGKRIVAEKNKSVKVQWYTPTRHAPNSKHTIFAKVHILTSTQIHPLTLEM